MVETKRHTAYGRCVLSRLLILAALVGCSSDPRGLDNDILSSLLSISNVTKKRLQDTSNPDLVSGVIVDSTVIHTGFLTINVPFRMTWTLRLDGIALATATYDFAAGFAPGASASVRVTLRFYPVSDLDNTTDVVTFDLLDDGSNTNILGGN